MNPNSRTAHIIMALVTGAFTLSLLDNYAQKFREYYLAFASVACLAVLLPSLFSRSRLNKHISIPPRIRDLGTCLLIYWVWSLLSCFSAYDTERSWRDFFREICVFMVMYGSCVWLGIYGISALNRVQRACIALMGIAVCATFLVLVVYIAGPAGTRAWLDSHEIRGDTFVLKEMLSPTESVWRLQFPFGHHNRLGYFSMLSAVVFATMAWAASDRSPKLRGLFLALSLMATVNLLATLNRGAWIALACTGLVWAIVALRRGALILIPIAAVLFAVLPDTQKNRIRGLFTEQAYEDPQSTIAQRRTHFQAAMLTVKLNRMFGAGYGWRNYEKYYEHELLPRLKNSTSEALHAHNAWLQAFAETGVPGGVAFSTFTFVLIVLTAGSVLRAAKQTQSSDSQNSSFRQSLQMLSILVGMYVYALGNLPFREAVGVISWIILGAATVRLIPASNEEETNSVTLEG